MNVIKPQFRQLIQQVSAMRTPKNDMLLLQQVNLLVEIDEQASRAAQPERKFWEQAHELVAGAQDLGYALKMFDASAGVAQTKEHRQVLGQVAAMLRSALLGEPALVYDDSEG